MDCALCKKNIKGYNPDLNHLKIDEANSADICLECTDRILEWQQGVYAKLFPTYFVKKKFGKR